MTESTNRAARMRPRRLRHVADTDVLVAVVLVAISGVLLSQMGVGIRNWIFPRALTYSLLAIAAVLAVRGIARVATGRQAAIRIRPTEAIDVGNFVAGAVMYVLVVPLIGFWVTSIVMLVAASVFLSVRKSPRVAVVSLTVAAIVCIAAYLIFLHLFYVPLPTGWLLSPG